MPRKSKTASTAENAKGAATGSPWSVRAFNGPDLEQVTGAGQRSLVAMAQMHSRVFRDALRFNAELLDFASRRVRADIDASNRLARCDSATEAMDVMSEFYQGALRDYAEESTALVRLGTELSAEAAEATVAQGARRGGKTAG